MRKAPAALLERLEGCFVVREVGPRKALGKTKNLFSLILKGSVSLHVRKGRKTEGGVGYSFTPTPEQHKRAPGRQGTMLSKVNIEADIENRASRTWWKKRRVEAADNIIEGGFMIGSYADKLMGVGVGGYYCFTRTTTILVDFDVMKFNHFETYEGRRRRQACERLASQIVGSNDISLVDR